MSKIDTSTTAGKIQVMQAQENGNIIHAKDKCSGSGIIFSNSSGKETEWNWQEYDFFIKPQTVEDAANDYCSTYLNSSAQSSIRDAVIFGAKWQKEQDND